MEWGRVTAWSWLSWATKSLAWGEVLAGASLLALEVYIMCLRSNPGVWVTGGFIASLSGCRDGM